MRHAQPGDGAPRLPPARAVTRAALRQLPETTEEPVFLYVHYADPHTPYAPAPVYRRRFDSPSGIVSPQYLQDLVRGLRDADAAERKRLSDLYDAEVAQVDAAIGDLLEGLESRGFARDAVVVITSDGSAFSDSPTDECPSGINVQSWRDF